MGAGSALPIIMRMPIVLVIMAVVVWMCVVMMVMMLPLNRCVGVGLNLTFDFQLTFTAATYRTHYSTSSSLIRISSPRVTCN